MPSDKRQWAQTEIRDTQNSGKEFIICIQALQEVPQAWQRAPIVWDVQNSTGQILEQPPLRGARLEHLQRFPPTTVILWFYNHKTISIRLLTSVPFQVPTRILALFSKYRVDNGNILYCGRTSPNRFSATSSNSILLKFIYTVRHNSHSCTFSKGNGSCRWNVTQESVSPCLQTEKLLMRHISNSPFGLIKLTKYLKYTRKIKWITK